MCLIVVVYTIVDNLVSLSEDMCRCCIEVKFIFQQQRQLHHQIKEQEEIMRRKDATIRENEVALQQKDETIQHKDAEIVDLHNQLESSSSLRST